MKAIIEWVEFQGGFLGVLPCGITIAQERIQDGPYMGGYKVRFGTCEIRKIFWNPIEARAAGRDLAREVLQTCLEAVDADNEPFARGKTQ